MMRLTKVTNKVLSGSCLSISDGGKELIIFQKLVEKIEESISCHIVNVRKIEL